MIQPTVFAFPSIASPQKVIEINREPLTGNNYRNDLQLIRQETYSGAIRYIDRKVDRKTLSFTLNRLSQEQTEDFEDFYRTVSESLEYFELLIVPLSPEVFKSGVKYQGKLVDNQTFIRGKLIDTARPYAVWDRYPYENVRFKNAVIQPVTMNRGKSYTVSIEVEIEG